MATGVEVKVSRGNVEVRARGNRDRFILKAGESKSVSIHKDRPVYIVVHSTARATAQSTTGILLLIEHEDEYGFTVETKLKPPLKLALPEGRYVVMAPSAA